MLIIPGSDDPKYTASKLHSYILSKKPIIAIFNEASSVVKILEDVQTGYTIKFEVI